MADKRTNEEIRQDVFKKDSSRDVNFYAAIFIAVAATISSSAAILAVLCLGFLADFREDVKNVWMSCLPLCFTFITGVALAYRKHLADVGVHIALAIVTLLAGGVGYGLSITPVYLNRHNCTLPSDYNGDCQQEFLTMTYFISGGVASGFGVLSFLGSLCACSNAMGRRVRRQRLREMYLEHEEEKKGREIKEHKRRLGMPPSSPSPPPAAAAPAAAPPTVPSAVPPASPAPVTAEKSPPPKPANGIIVNHKPLTRSVSTSTERLPRPRTEIVWELASETQKSSTEAEETTADEAERPLSETETLSLRSQSGDDSKTESDDVVLDDKSDNNTTEKTEMDHKAENETAAKVMTHL